MLSNALTSATSPLHLLGNFDDPFAGAERELPDLALRMQSRRACQLWATGRVHPAFAGLSKLPIRPVSAFGGAFPRGGMLLIGGVHVPLGVWLAHGKFERIALRYNITDNGRLFDYVQQIRQQCGINPELLFVSEMQKLSVGLPGLVEPSLIILDDYLAIQREPQRTFTVGRVSRDVPGKHHADDPALYRMLAAYGYQVRVMGAMCLQAQVGQELGVTLLPVGAEKVSDFYRGLDAMVYRTGAQIESYGRVVFEAMASALPVVVEARHGCAQYIVDGKEGFLVRSQEEALDCLRFLATHEQERLAMGQAARQKAVELHGEQVLDHWLAFYLD